MKAFVLPSLPLCPACNRVMAADDAFRPNQPVIVRCVNWECDEKQKPFAMSLLSVDLEPA